MDIKSKFIYAKTKAAFEEQIVNIPENLNPIVFIEDTKEMWTMGTYFSIGIPSIQVSEISGSVKVEVGNSSFTIETSGSSLSVRKGDNNSIIINSNALTKVDTELPLQWDTVEKKLIHSTSGATAGNYGQSSNLENASIINIPYISVNNTGHITAISTKVISIRDYVEQLAPNALIGDRNVLLSYNESNSNNDTAQTRKARGLTYNSLSQILTVGGGANINGPTNVVGDLTVTEGDIVGNLRGNVTGEATPKIHLSLNPEYGGASLNLYGHVKVQDELTETAPPLSSDNSSIDASNVTNGIAASPYMVWKAKDDLHTEITNAPSLGGIVIGSETITITEARQVISLSGQNGINVSVQEGGIVIKGVDMKGYTEDEQEKAILDSLTFSMDFNIDNTSNELSIRWIEIQ